MLSPILPTLLMNTIIFSKVQIIIIISYYNSISRPDQTIIFVWKKQQCTSHWEETEGSACCVETICISTLKENVESSHTFSDLSWKIWLYRCDSLPYVLSALNMKRDDFIFGKQRLSSSALYPGDLLCPSTLRLDGD